jgi:hypothetical protein
MRSTPFAHPALRLGGAAITLALLLSAPSQGWFISGIVKDGATNAGLQNVSIVVKDSTNIKTTSASGGAFTLEHSVGVQARDLSRASNARIDGSDLVVEGLADGPVNLAFVNASGRVLWSMSTESRQGVARTSLPSNLARNAIFLRIGTAHGTLIQAVNVTPSGLSISPAAGRALAAYPVLEFTLAGYEKVTYTMTSERMTGVEITMTKTPSDTTCELGTTFKWKDYGKPIAEPKNGWLAIKDFTMVRYNNQYIVYLTYTPQAGGFLAGYMDPFADFPNAAAAGQYVMPNRLPGVAPELIYFTPKKQWVFTTQWCGGGFCYTTGSDPTKPTTFNATTQSLLSENVTANAPIDQVVICDDDKCYLFYADDAGGIFRGSMPKANFPSKFTGTTRILKENDAAKLFEAVEVYKLKGQKKYIMIVECGYPRYFRAFTATDLGGTWTPIANTININTPFAGPKNVTNGWSNDISHGEIVRTGYDEYREIDPCNMKMIYQGLTSGGDYSKLPYRMGLITRIP